MIKTTEKLILTDVDGVLLDWPTHFHRWMAYKGHQRVHNYTPLYNQELQYNLSHIEGRRQVSEFLGSAWMIGLPAFRDAKQGVARLVEAGYKFHAITAIDDDPYVKDLRMMNLINLFGKDTFVDLTCVGFDADKTYALEPYRNSRLPWIEDKVSNAELGVSMGLSSYLIEHLYSADYTHEHVVKVNDWNMLCGKLLSDS